MVKGAVGARLRANELSPILGQLLNAAIAENRHAPLLDGAIRWAARALATNEHLIRTMVHERAGSVLRWTGLDESLSDRIIDGLDKLLGEMARNPQHPLRCARRTASTGSPGTCSTIPETRLRVESLKAELIDNPAVQRWLDGMWEQARAGLLKIARDPERVMAGKLGDMLRQLGHTLQTDQRLGHTINRFTRRAVVGIAADYGDGIVRLVSETVRGWDADTITRRLENAVGKDLQYIRVNGTIVGGWSGC
jgi:uncharacterized membrane-anchored protein YjiN (DUF445 family)